MKRIWARTGNYGWTRALKAVQLLSGAALLAGAFLALPALSAHAANSVSKSTTPPSTNIIESFVPGGNTSNVAIRRLNGLTGATNTRADGQAFQVGTAFTIAAVTLQSNAVWTYDALTEHVIQMAVLEDTDADGILDAQFGSTETFHMAGLSLAVNDFVTFTLGTPTAALQANRKCGVHFWWTTDDPQNEFSVVRSNSGTDEYTKGGYFFDTNRNFPLPIGAEHATSDFRFYIQGVEVAGPEVEVKDGATNIPDDGGPVDFGVATLGAAALSKTFTVNNLGTAALTTSNLAVPAGYSITEGLSASIPASGSDTFTVELPTTTGGTFSGSISFDNNDSDESPYNFSVTGRIQTVSRAKYWSRFD